MFNWRIALGLILAPLVPGILFSIPVMIQDGSTMVFWYIKFSAFAGYPVMLILGLPIHLLFQRLGWTNGSLYAALGAFLGAVAYFVAFLPGIISDSPKISYAMTTTIGLLPVSIICGIIAVFTFWLITVRSYGKHGVQ